MAHPQSLELKADSDKTADSYCMLQSDPNELHVLEIFGKRHSRAGAVLKGTAGHNMWARGESL